MNRDAFLRRLADRPAGSHLPATEKPPALPPAAEDLCAAFTAAARATGSTVARGSSADLAKVLRAAVGAGPAFSQDAPELALLLPGIALLAQDGDPFSAPWGVSLAEAGLARTGSACLRREPGRSLQASLVPARAAILVPTSRLVWELGDYMNAAPAHGTVHVVSGPSRSADIENDLSIGVHGPAEVLYLLWEG